MSDRNNVYDWRVSWCVVSGQHNNSSQEMAVHFEDSSNGKRYKEALEKLMVQGQVKKENGQFIPTDPFLQQWNDDTFFRLLADEFRNHPALKSPTDSRIAKKTSEMFLKNPKCVLDSVCQGRIGDLLLWGILTNRVRQKSANATKIEIVKLIDDIHIQNPRF